MGLGLIYLITSRITLNIGIHKFRVTNTRKATIILYITHTKKKHIIAILKKLLLALTLTNAFVEG